MFIISLTKIIGGEVVIKYSRKMHGGELWATIEVLENVFTPLFKNK